MIDHRSEEQVLLSASDDEMEMRRLQNERRPIEGLMEVLPDAKTGTEQEHDLSPQKALRLFYVGVFWSVVVALTIIMEGYDTKLISTLFAQPAFQKRFGRKVPGKEDSYQLAPPWQAALNNASTLGQLVGILVSAPVSERYGFRKTMLIGLTAITCFIFVEFLAPNLAVLVSGLILIGIPLGLFQTTTVVYAYELVPLRLRAYLTNYVHMCWAFGQFLAVGILRALLNRTDEWGYRIAFGLQWFWPCILVPLMWFAPESPWWLVRQGRQDDARQVLRHLTSYNDLHFDVDKAIALMVLTTETERRADNETSYKACFTGTNLRRTLIVIGIYCVQTLNGNPLRGQSTYFFEQAGMNSSQAFDMSIGVLAVAIAAGFFSWVLLPLAGRRKVYLITLVLMTIMMVSIGALGVKQAQDPTQKDYAWGIGSIIIVSSFLYFSTIGPLTNTWVSEIPSSILRSKSIAVARWVYAVSTIVVGVISTYQLNPLAWDWRGMTGFFWAGTCFLCILFIYFYCPESKDRTTAELDTMFERRISAQRFKRTRVDIVEVIDLEERAVV